MLVWRKILAHGLKRLATPALHLWRIRHGLVEELALCIKSLATPGIECKDIEALFAYHTIRKIVFLHFTPYSNLQNANRNQLKCSFCLYQALTEMHQPKTKQKSGKQAKSLIGYVPAW